MPAPITLFVHAKPDHATAALDALKQCELADQSYLTVFCDGPSGPDEQDGVDRVRAIARNTVGFKHLDVVEFATHKGRSQLICDGVSQIVGSHGRVIVVEDDLIVAPHFLQYINEGLDKYAAEESVVSICGYSYRSQSGLPETYFLPGAHSWGWATWRRGWEIFRSDADGLVKDITEQGLIYAFDSGGAEPLTQLLSESARNEELSWSLCWMASAILVDKLTLYPGRSLVAHCDYSAGAAAVAPVIKSSLSSEAVRVEPTIIEVNDDLMREVKASFLAWRGAKNAKVRMYALLSSLLPRRFEKKIYTSMISRKLRNSGRRAATSMRASARDTQQNAVAE